MDGHAIDAAAPVLVPLKGIRGSIARNMTAGWQAPRVALGMEVDMRRCQLLRTRLQERAGPGTRLSITPIVLRALALTLRNHPAMNALMRDGAIEHMPGVHLNLAVALDEGLAVPVIRDADTKSIEQLAAEAVALATGARAGKLPPKAYQGGTFTVSSLGAAGVDWFTPILNPPQVGILGLARVADRPVVQGGKLLIVPMTTLSLVFDHRAIDGNPAALFLAELKARLESCEGL
ncbi:dihydrolipoamide acetyltransferase family protein [Pseudoduganella namucuonensis]|uniref:Pyruvate dehydrogenase E2 component (Dihydrolipoamide acetyltransferase) n=1 Tax=Pseudoduganella namucuonensis TaxID=1035707 RepID=A0A1I7LX09_9BURK|nr:dihydrolipoamide acetyltransferase family protein [Pseudoduganella namucuonensis]SFV14222.1 pyruvate dehydrogenase E2 component (dihydrolipoamide acetyltransferase) [Pseudoduganella namucuonensis]